MRPLIIILALFLVIQFIQPEKTNPPATAEINAPTTVLKILKESCYDCHSNLTKWPWYSKIAPSSWLIIKHVNDGRSELNFSEWRKKSMKIRDNWKREIWEEISNDKMPLPMYTWLHPSATLTLNERQAIKKWATGK